MLRIAARAADTSIDVIGACLTNFVPKLSLVDGSAPLACKAVVVIPARNEEDSLCATLDSLAAQVDSRGVMLPRDLFEVILLLNNCTDSSATVARSWCTANESVNVHVCERSFEGADAHVGMARSLLMDSAWQRLAGEARSACAIMTTDADTVLAPDWVFRNLEALEAGADVVGGCIYLNASALPPQARLAYERDREYQQLVAELEDRLDPQEGDRSPRHLEHFGGSLACTPAIYARAGGMPAITPLEDVAFIDRLRRIDARIRHEPKVRVFTSARLAGRVDVGLSGQLRQWQAMAEDGAVHRVAAPEYLQHRFNKLRELRQLYLHGNERGDARTCGQFLADIDCNRLIDESYSGVRDCGITEAIETLKAVLAEEGLCAVRP